MLAFLGLSQELPAQGLRSNLDFLLAQTKRGSGPYREIQLGGLQEKQSFILPIAKMRETPEGFVGQMRLRLISDSTSFQNGLLVLPSFDLLEMEIKHPLWGQDTIFAGIAYRGPSKRTYRNVFHEEVSWLRMGRRNQLILNVTPEDTIDLSLRYAHMTDMLLEEEISWWPEEAVRKAERNLGYKWLMEVLLLGVMLFIMGYQFMLFFLNQGYIHLVYGLYVLAFMLQSLDYSGILAISLLEGMPLFRGTIKLTADFGVALFYISFWMFILESDRRFPTWFRIYNLMRLILVVSWIGCVIYLYVSYQFYAAIHFANFLILGIVIPMVFAFPRLIAEKDRIINLLLIGFSILFTANVINSVFIMAGIDSIYAIGFLDRFNFFQIGGFIEVCWFMMIINYQQQRSLAKSMRIQADRKAQAEFLRQLNHEVRTPLALILGPLELLKKEQLSPSGRRNVALLRSYTERLSHLIHQMLNLASVQDKQVPEAPNGVEISEFLEERKAYFLPMAQAKAISLDLNHPIEPARALADAEKLRVILDNLLHNAIKYTPGGGSIHINWYREGREAGIMVADTGYGIPASQLQRIFEPYHQVKRPAADQNPGTGVGLSLVKNLLEELGGRIHVESFEGQGSTFTIHIPLETTVKAPAYPTEGEVSNFLPDALD